MSGHETFLLYKRTCEIDHEMFEGEVNEQDAAQVIYHCMFGTYKEDLSILEQITNCATWYTREQLGKRFQKMTTIGKSVKTQLIIQKMYSKMSSANQTDFLASAYLQTVAVPIFSGYRTQTIGEDFFENVLKDRGQ